MSTSLLDYAGYACPVEGLGPGRRCIIWVRGCHRHCPGCVAPEMWETGEALSIEPLARELLPRLAGVDGLTISGGEPFNQTAALCALIDRLREELDVEVLVYTGFLLEELRAGGGDAAALLDRLDILIDGPFMEGEPNTLQWRGSDNQRVHLLSPRARRHAGQENLPMREPRPLQVQMVTPVSFRVIGIPRRGDVAAYRQAMKVLREKVQE
ncbi:MAG: anaerobic ribonucleotide reductase-activating protein [bacterium ADurb.Bin429]|nr:MAG: anaerobic ribonucleotide reductase-activating protein [bacterium ADurb.Bin429]